MRCLNLPMTESSLITFNQVSKVYANGTVALQDINLAIAPGQFVSLVGPSGCGKSTILKLMAGLGQPTTGTIQWGSALNPTQPDQRQLAFVFQDAALMPWATVMENIHLPLKLQGKSLRGCRGAIADVIQQVGLQGTEHQYPRQLSGGMKMRVSIARALVTQPKVLLMDEPFGALDEMTRSKLNGDVLRLWEEQHWTVVFVTHNIYEAVYLSNRVIIMAAQPGRILGEVTIQVPYPRSEDFRTSGLFNQYCREILNQLTRYSPEII